MLRNVEKKKRLSQFDLEELCNISRQTINAIENDKYNPSLQLAFDIAENLGVRIDKLFINKGVEKNRS
ncbi:helix-turn-helix transcriptional regulator [Clostridium sp. BJN0013]|uniref:helix-turn-helix transcriptional regulator n=1 Tax=Clostridium sp. BJN0013 TaxID=3236840 RepID=UPI0034C5F1CD